MKRSIVAPEGHRVSLMRRPNIESQDRVRVFVSHENSEKDWALALGEALPAENYRVLVSSAGRKDAAEGLRPGDLWAECLNKQVRLSDLFVVLVSPHSCDSKAVQYEVVLADSTHRMTNERRPRIVPIHIAGNRSCGRLGFSLTAFQSINWPNLESAEDIANGLRSDLGDRPIPYRPPFEKLSALSDRLKRVLRTPKEDHEQSVIQEDFHELADLTDTLRDEAARSGCANLSELATFAEQILATGKDLDARLQNARGDLAARGNLAEPLSTLFRSNIRNFFSKQHAELLQIIGDLPEPNTVISLLHELTAKIAPVHGILSNILSLHRVELFEFMAGESDESLRAKVRGRLWRSLDYVLHIELVSQRNLTHFFDSVDSDSHDPVTDYMRRTHELIVAPEPVVDISTQALFGEPGFGDEDRAVVWRCLLHHDDSKVRARALKNAAISDLWDLVCLTNLPPSTTWEISKRLIEMGNGSDVAKIILDLRASDLCEAARRGLVLEQADGLCEFVLMFKETRCIREDWYRNALLELVAEVERAPSCGESQMVDFAEFGQKLRRDYISEEAELPGSSTLNELSLRAKEIVAQSPRYLSHFLCHADNATAMLALRQLRRARSLVVSKKVLGNPKINKYLLRNIASRDMLRSPQAQKFLAFNPKADFSSCTWFLNGWPPKDLARLAKSYDAAANIRAYAKRRIQRSPM